MAAKSAPLDMAPLMLLLHLLALLVELASMLVLLLHLELLHLLTVPISMVFKPTLVAL